MSKDISIHCSFCNKLMPRDEEHNYKCINTDCGKGYIVGPHGVSIEIDNLGRRVFTAASPLKVVENG